MSRATGLPISYEITDFKAVRRAKADETALLQRPLLNIGNKLTSLEEVQFTFQVIKHLHCKLKTDTRRNRNQSL